MWLTKYVLVAISILIGTLTAVADPVQRSSPRIVPQLEVTRLTPRIVRFTPDGNDLVLVLNNSGRIDVFDITNPQQPIKLVELFGNFLDAIFSRSSSDREHVRLITGAVDGDLQLWDLDGKAVGAPLRGHDAPIRSLAISRDGGRIASGDANGTVRLWTEDGQAVGSPIKLGGHVPGRDQAAAIAFSADDQSFVAISENGIVQRFTRDGAPIGDFQRIFSDRARSITFSPDLMWVARAYGKGIELVALDGSKLRKSIPSAGENIGQVAFTRDGKQIVSGDNAGAVRIWNLDGRPAIEPIYADGGVFSSLAVSGDGFVVAAVSATGVQFWALSGRLIRPSFQGYDDRSIRSIAFPSDGKPILSGGHWGTVAMSSLDGVSAGASFEATDKSSRVPVWISAISYADNGTHIVTADRFGVISTWSREGARIKGPFEARSSPDGELALALSSDGNLVASGSEDGTIGVWTVNGTPAGSATKPSASAVRAIAFSGDGSRLVSGSQDGRVEMRTLDGRDGANVLVPSGPAITAVAFSSDNSHVAVGDELGGLTIWNSDKTHTKTIALGGSRAASALAFSSDGSRVLSGGIDGTVRLWAVDASSAAQPLRGAAGEVTGVTFSPDGKFIASASGHGIQIWTLEGVPVLELPSGDGRQMARIRASRDAQRFLAQIEPRQGGLEGSLSLWGIGENPKEPFKDVSEQNSISSIALASDGTIAALGDDKGHIHLVRADGTRAGDDILVGKSPVMSVAFSSDGTHLASADEHGTSLWRRDGALVSGPMDENHRVILALALSEDGTKIISGGSDGTIQIWGADGKPSAPRFKTTDTSTEKEIVAVAFTPDEKHFVAVTHGGNVAIWDIATGVSSPLRFCPRPSGMGFTDRRLFWIGCFDRIQIEDNSFRAKGELYFTDGGLAAQIDEGTFIPNAHLDQPFRRILPGAQVDWQRGAIAERPLPRIKRVLLDSWTFEERMTDAIEQAVQKTSAEIRGLGLWNLAVLPIFGWFLVASTALVAWVVVPARLARWSMPSAADISKAPLPKWQFLTNSLLVYGYLGSTVRPTKAWLRVHRASLLEQAFDGSAAVKEREAYADLARAGDISRLADAISGRKGACAWITGPGGVGKSALAYRILHAAADRHSSAPLPVLVDENWDATIAEHVAMLLAIGDRRPTAGMVQILGSRNLICLLIDQLSERTTEKAEKQVVRAASAGVFRSVIVTSQMPPDASTGWGDREVLTVDPLTPSQVPGYIEVYVQDIPAGANELIGVPENERLEAWRKTIQDRIDPVTKDGKAMSPLFVRFAIIQAASGNPTAITNIDLVLQYVEALRKDRFDIAPLDMRRAAARVATEAMRGSNSPQERSEAYLRGALATESDRLKFMNADSKGIIDPGEVLEMLIASGLLIQNKINRNLQFAYDPVAEQLDKWRAAEAISAGDSVPLPTRHPSIFDNSSDRAASPVGPGAEHALAKDSG